MERKLILKQDRPYHSRKPFTNALNQTVNYFDTAGNDNATNLDVAGQISNSADYEIFIMQWQFMRTNRGALLLVDLVFLANAVISGYMSLNINKIDEWTGNISSFLKPPMSEAIDTRKQDQESGKYTLNVPLTVTKGQPIKLPISYAFDADPSEFTSEVTFFGVLKTYQEVNVVT